MVMVMVIGDPVSQLISIKYQQVVALMPNYVQWTFGSFTLCNRDYRKIKK